jgi:hypothetical protein
MSLVTDSTYFSEIQTTHPLLIIITDDFDLLDSHLTKVKEKVTFSRNDFSETDEYLTNQKYLLKDETHCVTSLCIVEKLSFFFQI